MFLGLRAFGARVLILWSLCHTGCSN